MSKLIEKIKGLFTEIKDKTEPQRSFMRDGQFGGIIAEIILAAQFFNWIIYETALGKLPRFVTFNITFTIIGFCAALLGLVIKLIFGEVKWHRAFFITSLFVVCANHCIANQGNAIPGAVIMSLALVLSAELLGRCVWGFLSKKNFKQVFAYVVSGICLVYMAFYGVFFHFDCWGSNRVEFYNNIKKSMPVISAEIPDGFDKYLEDGPCQVKTLSYGPEEDADIVTDTVDYSVFDSVDERNPMAKLTDKISNYDYAKTPVRGQIYYPEGRTDCPVFFIVHGAHLSTTPSYLGYEYLGKYLASNGYVVVSVDENIINQLGEGNDKRAILLLDNMKAILAENGRTDSKIEGLIDADRIAIGGHSRGGEMVATAYLFNDMDTYPEDGNVTFDYHFNITSVVAIAPVVDQYRPVSRSVEISDVNYLLIHGSNDQDVSVMMGEKQYNNVTFSDAESEQFLKASVYILGANHGQFNSLWGRYDLTEGTSGFLNTYNFIEESDQQLIAKAYIRTFLDSTMGIDDTYISLLCDTKGYEDYLPDTVYITNYEDSEYAKLCDFDDSANISSFGDVSVNVKNSDTWTIKPYERGDGGEGEDYVLSLSWTEDSEPSVEITFPGTDISNGRLCFRMADMREDTEDITAGLDYSVMLTDASGNTVSCHAPEPVYHTLAVQLYKQDVFFNSYEYKHQLQTVNITPRMFEQDGSFDFTQVTGLTVTTDGAKEGELIINDVGYYER